MAITIGATKYRVIEDLGFHQDTGLQAKVVWADGKERVAVKRLGTWHFWGMEDRLSAVPTGPVVGQ